MKDCYYRIKDRNLIGKQEKGEFYIYRDGRWQEDVDWIIQDRLHGFDPTADPDDSYGYGVTDIMEKIEKITKEEALAEIK